MADILLPLTESSEISPQKSRPSTPFSVLLKQYLKINLLIRKRNSTYYVNYIVGVIMPMFYLVITMMPSININEDKNPENFYYPNELEATRYVFSFPNSKLYVTPENNYTQNLRLNMFGITNPDYYEFLPDIKGIAKEMNNDTTGSFSAIFGLKVENELNNEIQEKNQLFENQRNSSNVIKNGGKIAFTLLTTSMSYVYNPLAFINAITEFMLNKTLFIQFSSREFATPKVSVSISAASIGLVYFMIGKAIVVLSSVLQFFQLNYNKQLFLLEINGISNKVRFVGTFIIYACEHLLGDIICTVLFCFVAGASKNSNFLIFLASFLMFDISVVSIQVFFAPILKSKGSCSAFGILLILYFLLFEYYNIFQIFFPSILCKIIIFLFPPASFITSCDLMIRKKEDSGPMGFNTLDFKFNNVSESLTLLAQLVNCLIFVSFALIGNLCNTSCYGKPPLGGWKNLFKIGAWKKMLSKSQPISKHIFSASKNHKNNYQKTNNGNANLNIKTNNDFESTDNFNSINPKDFDPNSKAIEFEDLIKIYKGNKKKADTVALDNVSLKVDQGEVIVTIGPNGSGKSTLVSSIIGAIDVDAGSIKFYGNELINNFDLLYDTLGVTFQENVLFDKLTMKEHFLIFGAMNGFSQSHAANDMTYFTSMLNLSEYIDTFADKLSGGSKRKLCIALSLLRRPSVIVLDEPTAGVDAQSRQLIWKVLNDFHGATVFITTHSIEESESISSRLIVMSQGQIAFAGTAAELREKYNCCYFVSIIDENVDMEKVLMVAKEKNQNVRIHPEHRKILMVPNNLMFADVLSHIEEKKNELGVTKYTVRVENLEETMRKIIDDEEALLRND